MCLTVNPGRAGGAYGYVDMGGWIGGQPPLRHGPLCRFQSAQVSGKNEAMSKIMDLTMLTDILPTGFPARLKAGVNRARRSTSQALVP